MVGHSPAPPGGAANRGVWLFHYVVARLLWLIPTLLAMALVTFLVMHATPGSPLDPVAEGANPLSPEAQKNLAAAYGLDKPLWEQFAIFVGKAVRGDFGNSFVYKTRTVSEILVETFPVSLFLGAMALVLAVAGGVSLGVLAATYQNRTWDYVSVTLATFGVAVPNFVLAVFLIILFSFVLPLFPDRGLGFVAELGAAHGDPGPGPHGAHRALHAGQHARGHPLRLHPHRAGQGPGRGAR